MNAHATPTVANAGRSDAVAADGCGPVVLVNHLVEPPGRITGISRYAFGLIEALLRRRDARYVLATAFSRDELPPAIADGLHGLVTLPHIRSTPRNYLAQRGMLRKAAARYGAEIVYAMNPMCIGLPGLPSIVTVHDLYMEMLPDLYAFRHRLWWKLFFADAARRADAIACVSRNTADDVERLHPGTRGRTHLVPGAGVLPVRSGHDARRPPAGEPYVLLLGNVTPNKNVGFLFDALEKLRTEGRPVRAFHVGRDLGGDLARALAGHTPGLVEALGGVDDAVLDNVLGHAAALVQPSRYEGFGLPIIEAHDRGVPVIASDIPVFREVVGDGGVLVPLDDVAAMAEAVHRIVADGAWRAHLATQAKTNAARFTWDRSAEAAHALIDRCLAPARSRA